MSIRVMVVAADPLARAGLAALLEEAGATVVGRDDGESVLAAAEAYQPEVVVWALEVGEEASVLDELCDLTDLELPTLLLLADEVEVAELIKGAQALLPRTAEASMIAAALEAIMSGLFVIAPAFLEALTPLQSEPEPLQEGLTTREMMVLQLLAEGLANKAIAKRLGISESTVKFHLTAIMGKLGARSRTEAVARAARLGLILL